MCFPSFSTSEHRGMAWFRQRSSTAFIHDALVEAIEAGETHITKSCLPKYIHSLQCIDVTDDKQNPHKVLEKQYKVIDQKE